MQAPVLKAPLGVGVVRIGITGGIGSGKSTVARLFGLLGVPLYNADDAAKKLMNESHVIREKLIATFGKDAYTENGTLNRSWLASKVFGNAEKLQQLNSIVHPIVIQHGIDWMAAQTAPFTMKEAAIFFESGSAAGLDYIIGVFAPEELRIRRVIGRDGITRQEVLSRMSRQIDEDIKMRLCDFVIVNDDQQLVIPQVLALHQHLLELAKN
jgi:dephospho-CoA kinase